MIRVLNIISDTNIGGAGRVILNYLSYADRSQYETMVAIPRGSMLKEPLEQAGAQVYEVDGMADRSYHRDDVKVLKELIRRIKPDLVHTHGALSGRIAAKGLHVPVVYSRHSAFPVPAKIKYPPGRWVNKLVNEHFADHIIAVSPATRDNLTEGGDFPQKDHRGDERRGPGGGDRARGPRQAPAGAFHPSGHGGIRHPGPDRGL